MFLQNYSHYSVLKSILKPSDIVDIAVKYEHPAIAITDLNSMAGVAQFQRAANKAGIKPIMGLTVCCQDGGTLLLLAKNHEGYIELLNVLAATNTKENYVRYNAINPEQFRELQTDNLIAITGHSGSSLYQFAEYEEQENIDNYLNLLSDSFKDIRIQSEIEANDIVVDQIESIAAKRGLAVLNTNQIHYTDSEDSKYLYNVIRAKEAKTAIKNLPDVQGLFHPRIDSYVDYGANKELCEEIEEYNILSPPQLPVFDPLVNPAERLRELCIDGYNKKIRGLVPNEQQYRERAKEELEVFKNAGLSDYFLIIQDIIQHAESSGYLVGSSRGSVGGSLVAYLSGITKLDPMKYDLSFVRFYNKGREGSLPDIDVDFPKRSREHIFNYIRQKYGHENVGQIATYQTFMGRAALQAVFSAEGDMSFSECKQITKQIVDKSKISDELEQMREEGREPSVILWALENKARGLRDWAYLEDDKIKGPLAQRFERAIQLEGVKAAQAKHAAGVVVATKPLRETLPVLYDKDSGEQIVGMEYEDAESVGALKLDILGLKSLDVLEDIGALSCKGLSCTE